MKNIDIYEVSRDEYVGFLGQIKLNARRAETVEEDNNTILRVYSANTGVHLCSRVIPKEEGEEKYYVFNMPADDERKPPEAIRKIILSTKEEVQTFFDALSKIQKGEMKND